MAPKRRVVTTSSALLDDNLGPRTTTAKQGLDIFGARQAESEGPRAGGKAPPVPGAADLEALKELSALQSLNPDAFAKMMAAVASEGGEKEVEELWRRAASEPKGPATGATGDGELELPGSKVLRPDGSTREAQEASIKVVPVPGFVVKTFCLLKKELAAADDDEGPTTRSVKYFINICGHDAVQLPSADRRLDAAGKEVEGIAVPVSIGPERGCDDAKGDLAVAVDVVVNLAYLNEAKEDPSRRDFLCELALNQVGAKYKKPLDRKYKLPRLKYKGGTPEENHQFVRDASKEKKKVQTVSATEAPKAPTLEATLGPPCACTFSVVYPGENNNVAASSKRPFFDRQEDWPLVVSTSEKEGRPAQVVAHFSIPRLPSELDDSRNPFLAAAASASYSEYAVAATVPGRAPSRHTLPFVVLRRAGATLCCASQTPGEWRADITMDVDPADVDADGGPDVGSKPWRVARAISSQNERSGDDAHRPKRGGCGGGGDDDGDERAPEDTRTASEKYHLAQPAVATSSILPPKGASAMELAYTATRAAEVAARAVQAAAEDDDAPLPEDRFHKADILSQHYISQRESQTKEKHDRADQDREERKKDTNVEYLDMDDFKPGGKHCKDEAAAEVAAPPATAAPVEPRGPPPTVAGAAMKNRKGPKLSSKFAELL